MGIGAPPRVRAAAPLERPIHESPLERSATQVTEDRDSPKSVLASLETTRFCHFITDAPLGVVLEPTDDGGVVVKSVTPDGRAASFFPRLQRDVTGLNNAGAAAARFGVKVGERVWRVNGRAVGEALDFNGVVGLCRQRPVALDLVDAEA